MRGVDACREIRLSLMGNVKRGEIIGGFNTHTGEWDLVQVVKVHRDYNLTTLRPLRPETAEKILQRAHRRRKAKA